MARRGYNATMQSLERRKKIRRGFGNAGRWLGRKGWKIFLAVVILAVAVWQGWFWIRQFSPSELRTLKTIDISGNRMLTWEEILQTAGLETGMPMSEIDADSVRKKLLSLPLIADAKIDVGFFWKVGISVRETTPILLSLENGNWKAFSERGMPLPITVMSAWNLPVATANRPQEIRQIAGFLQKMRSADARLYGDVSQVRLDEKAHAFEVFFSSVRFKVLFPLDSVSEKTFSNYRRLLEGGELREQMVNVKLLDMRFEGFSYAHLAAEEVKR